MTYRNVKVAPDHPLAPPCGLIGEHRLALYERFPNGAPCHWCGRPLRWYAGKWYGDDVLITDHLNGNVRDNRPENLMPSCHPCNRNRPRAIGDDEVWVRVGDGRAGRTRGVVKQCAFCGAEFVTRLKPSRPSAGRFCSRDCMYASHRR